MISPRISHVEVFDHSRLCARSLQLQGQYLYTIGGEQVPSSIDEGEDEVNTLSDVCQLDLEAGLWTDMPISGDSLSVRLMHSCNISESRRILLAPSKPPCCSQTEVPWTMPRRSSTLF